MEPAPALFDWSETPFEIPQHPSRVHSFSTTKWTFFDVPAKVIYGMDTGVVLCNAALNWHCLKAKEAFVLSHCSISTTTADDAAQQWC